MKRLFALFILVFATVLPVLAQDVSSTADPSITLKWWQVLAGLLSAVAAGGVIGIGGFGVIARRMRNDPATMAAIEGLAKSVPANVAMAILATARNTEAVAGLLEEAFDGIPAVDKAALPAMTTVTTTSVTASPDAIAGIG